jgi:hypothetical protein
MLSLNGQQGTHRKAADTHFHPSHHTRLQQDSPHVGSMPRKVKGSVMGLIQVLGGPLGRTNASYTTRQRSSIASRSPAAQHHHCASPTTATPHPAAVIGRHSSASHEQAAAAMLSAAAAAPTRWFSRVKVLPPKPSRPCTPMPAKIILMAGRDSPAPGAGRHVLSQAGARCV